MGARIKTQILAAPVENDLQQASALNAGLAANDRIKYAFSLLQMAIEHARHPEQPAAGQKRERLAAGIDDGRLDEAVAGAQVVGQGSSCLWSGRSPATDRGRHAPDGGSGICGAACIRWVGFGDRLTALPAALPGAKNDLVDP